MTTIHLLALAGYFLILYEYIAMRHRDICAESDARINFAIEIRINRGACCMTLREWREAVNAQKLYWNRGTK